MTKPPINVLIAEDSSTVRALLVAAISNDARFRVMGQATTGEEAVRMAKELKPDVITMDIEMPLMNGFEATREIMIEQPTPIVIVSGRGDVREVTVSMQALSAGALAVHSKPTGPMSPGFGENIAELLHTLEMMSQVSVVRRYRSRVSVRPPEVIRARPAGGRGVVAIAISTGGPAALHQLLAAIPREFPAPILVVQHISRGFVTGLATWLNTVSSLRVKTAEQGELIIPRNVYLAPDDQHLGVTADGTRILLSEDPPIKGFRPAGTYLFESVARGCGRSMVAVIMTGMGDDGVAGLRRVRDAGGLIVAQDEESSVVFGMPGMAINEGLADVVLPLSAIVAQLMVQVNGGHRG